MNRELLFLKTQLENITNEIISQVKEDKDKKYIIENLETMKNILEKNM